MQHTHTNVCACMLVWCGDNILSCHLHTIALWTTFCSDGIIPKRWKTTITQMLYVKYACVIAERMNVRKCTHFGGTCLPIMNVCLCLCLCKIHACIVNEKWAVLFTVEMEFLFRKLFKQICRPVIFLCWMILTVTTSMYKVYYKLWFWKYSSISLWLLLSRFRIFLWCFVRPLHGRKNGNSIYVIYTTDYDSDDERKMFR